MSMPQTRSSRSTAARSSRFTGRRLHLVGVGGSGMQALARMLLDRGARLSGTDRESSDAVESLRTAGAQIRLGHGCENLPEACDALVYSAAVPADNPEILAARRRGVEVLKYAEMLGRLMAEHTGVAVSGTHGKSTTSAMTAYGLHRADLDPSFIVGAVVEQLGGPSGAGTGEHFVAEACEFDRSFLNLRPKIASVLNIEEDHLDCYRDLAAIVEAFGAFLAQVPPSGRVIVNGEDRNALQAARTARAPVETFGLSEGCTWRGVDVTSRRGLCELTVERAGEDFCRLKVPLPGLHNVYNALAATAMLSACGVEAARIPELLGDFRGTLRRATLKGRSAGVTVVDDYAHHPTEIQTTLRAIRDHYQPRRLLCVFQPHQHSRTRFLLKDFAQSFGLCDEVILPEIYFVRDSEKERQYISSEVLVSQIRFHGGRAEYRETFEDIVRYLQDSLQSGDLVVTMGAGNVWEIADDIVRWLGRHR
jgi:UDP-N-acetylmuramate--alanine ligase